MLRNSKYIFLVGWSLLSLVANGQWRKNIIIHPDTSDKYIIVFDDRLGYQILLGYKAFHESRSLDKIALNYIDSVRKYNDTVYLDTYSMQMSGNSKEFSTYFTVEEIIFSLIDSGSVKVYDCTQKKFLNHVKREKEKDKKIFGNTILWSYINPENKDLIFQDETEKLKLSKK